MEVKGVYVFKELIVGSPVGINNGLLSVFISGISEDKTLKNKGSI